MRICAEQAPFLWYDHHYNLGIPDVRVLGETVTLRAGGVPYRLSLPSVTEPAIKKNKHILLKSVRYLRFDAWRYLFNISDC